MESYLSFQMLEQTNYTNVYCGYCEISCTQDLEHKFVEMDHEIMESYNHYLLKCNKCNNFNLYKEIGFGSSEYELVYPVDSRKLNFKVPRNVEISWEEARRCEKNNIIIAGVVMVGRTLEAIIKDIYPEERLMLHKGIMKLKEEGKISDEFFEWANELKFLRNIGAHATEEALIYSDLKEAMDFLQAIIEIIYELRPKFEKMFIRRHPAESAN